MNRIEEVFGRAPVLLPVVHPIGREEALASLRVVNDAGAPGAFLIDQGMSEAEVLELIKEARARFPKLWLGVNLLSRSPADALTTALDACDGRIDGIWSDNAGVDEQAPAQPRAEELLAVRRARGWNGLYFGGTAFKYQREVAYADLGRTAALAARYVDVVCTSGPGTGQAVDVEKLRAMRTGLGDAALALASGVTAENVGTYVPYVQAFLVGTGIEASFGVIDAARVTALLRAMSR
jgi:uncharacterized protein